MYCKLLIIYNINAKTKVSYIKKYYIFICMYQTKFLKENNKQIFIKNRYNKLYKVLIYKYNNSRILKESYIKFRILKVLKMFFKKYKALEIVIMQFN